VGIRVTTALILSVITVLFLVALAAAAPTAHAADPPATPNLQLATSIDQVFNNIRNWLMGVLVGGAVVLFTLGGWRYLMGAGDPEEIHKAKIAFRSGAVGFGLAALAPLVVAILESLVA
jgi:hypothetical protein